MVRYHYKALSKTGEKESGHIDAAHEEEALKVIRGRGLSVFDLHESNEDQKSVLRFLFPSAFTVAASDQIAFLRSLAMMLKASLPIDQALSLITKSTRKRDLRIKLEALHTRVLSGEPLASALAAGGLGLGSEILGIIKLGSSTNNLPLVLETVVKNLEARLNAKSELLKASIYPILLLVFVVLVSLVLIFILVPALVPMFETSGKELPTTIAGLNLVNSFLNSNGRGLTLFFAILILSAVAILKLRPSLGHSILYRLPILRNYTKRAAELELLTSLHFSTGGGARLSDGLEFASETLSNEMAQGEIGKAVNGLKNGDSLEASLSTLSFLKDETLAAISAGEKANCLNDVFEQLQLNARKSLEGLSKNFIALITPITTIAIGLLIGGILFSTMSAILEVNDLAFQ